MTTGNSTSNRGEKMIRLQATSIWRTLATLLIALSLMLSQTQFATARFLTPDTWNPELPGVDFNRYAYAGNDPINASDPNGHSTEALILGSDEAGYAAISNIESLKGQQEQAVSAGDAALANQYQGFIDSYEQDIAGDADKTWKGHLLDFGIEGAEAAASGIGTGAGAIAKPAFEIKAVKESMSARAAAYEIQNFSPRGYTILVNGVRFDASIGRILVEVKGPGYTRLLNGKFGRQVMDKLLKQAERQSSAYKGRIEWRFAENSAANAFKRAIAGKSFAGQINVRYVPPKSSQSTWTKLKSWFGVK